MFQPMANVSYTVAYVKDGSIHSKHFLKNQTDKVFEVCQKLERLHVKYAVYSMGEHDNNYEHFGIGKTLKLADVVQSCRDKIEKYLKQHGDPIYFVEDFGDFYRVVTAADRPRFLMVAKKDDTMCGLYLVASND